MHSVQPDVAVEPNGNGKGGVSRRSFIKGLAAAGVGISVISSAARLVKADPYGPFLGADLTKEQLIDIQRKMLQIRWFTRTTFDTYLTQKWMQDRGPETHPVAGHEAAIVGAIAALNKDDYQQGYHRSWGHSIAKGADINRMAAEVVNMSTGTNKGYGGSLHLMQKDVGMLGEDGIVGPAIVLGAGAAFGVRARGTKQVVMAFTGEGVVGSPYLWIGLHNAAKFKLPFVYVVESDGYQGGHHFSLQSPLHDFADVGKSLEEVGLKTIIVDGMSALDVYSVAKRAVDRARAGEGPTLIEAKCYRYYDHNTLTGAKAGVLGAWGLAYRSDKELQYWIDQDPIPRFRKTLVAWGIQTEAEADQLEAQVKQQVVDAWRFAETSAPPKSEDAIRNVYVSDDVCLPRQLADCPLY